MESNYAKKNLRAFVHDGKHITINTINELISKQNLKNYKMNQTKFWKNKKILITGIDGFVGSNLAKKLVSLEAKVAGIVQKKKNSLLYFESVNKKCKIFKGEITNKLFIDNLVRKNNFEIVFHLAAQVEVGVANKSPYKTWESNVRGTYTILDRLQDVKNKSIIVALQISLMDHIQKYLPYKESYPSQAIYPAMCQKHALI